jgi:hypothetical protein
MTTHYLMSLTKIAEDARSLAREADHQHQQYIIKMERPDGTTLAALAARSASLADRLEDTVETIQGLAAALCEATHGDDESRP